MRRQKTSYFIDGYLRCGDMPLFLISCHDRQGQERHCVILCTFRRLKQLVRLRKGFSNPSQYGRVIYKGYGTLPNNTIRQILKTRYDFDLESSALTPILGGYISA